MKFFHAYASARKKSNFVSQLRTYEGLLVTEKEDINKVVLDYFNTVFAGQRQNNGNEMIEEGEQVTEEQNKELVADLSFLEFTVAVKQMHPDKASGPNGLNPAFFQHFWSSLGREVFASCRD